jgi:hypothetical protein
MESTRSVSPSGPSGSLGGVLLASLNPAVVCRPGLSHWCYMTTTCGTRQPGWTAETILSVVGLVLVLLLDLVI